MNDDWASDGEEEAGLGDISAIPEVKIPEQAPKPATPPQKPVAPPNAWTARQPNNVRNALRRPQQQQQQQQQLRQPHNPGPRQQRRENFSNSFAGSSERPERSNSRPGSSSGYSRPTTLYVTNLPYEATENSISAFFEGQGIRVINVRITRHSDTGNIKAAFVRLPPEQNKEQALAVDGRLFGSRNIHVKVDGTDGNRRRDRGGTLNSVSYGGSFGARERREDSGNGWGGGGWADRPSASVDPVDRRMGDSRDDRRRETPQPSDPTIPTGPPPAGRKKLQLKPRTKPLPVLDVDRRAIDPPRAPTSAPPVMDGDGDQPLNTGESVARSLPSSNSEKRDKADSSNGAAEHQQMRKQETSENTNEVWTAAKETSTARQASANPSLNKKEDDSKRPVLLNTFAALEVNDSDA